jgi:hypothetical protein
MFRQLLVGLIIISTAVAADFTISADKPTLALIQTALGNDAAADAARERLRQKGPGIMRVLDEDYRDAQVSIQSRMYPDKGAAERLKLARTWDPVFDAVGQQFLCRHSRMYWFTDLEAAKQEAKRTGKPILSLRLLGKLTDEMSCANSRYFRVVLYANEQVGAYMHDNFVLHWSSERPVPKVTIDFGDGRKLQTTVTGNSTHYVLDQNGGVLDAIPGLYAPEDFQAELTRAVELLGQMNRLTGNTKSDALHAYHGTRLSDLQANWQAQTGLTDLPRLPVMIAPDAWAAAPRAESKIMLEGPLLKALAQGSISSEPVADARTSIFPVLDYGIHFAALANRSLEFDTKSRALLRERHQVAAKFGYPTPFEDQLTAMQVSTALDTVRNQYLMHAEIHRWLADSYGTLPFEELNRRIYTDLFLTPADDKWLGLWPLMPEAAVFFGC